MKYIYTLLLSVFASFSFAQELDLYTTTSRLQEAVNADPEGWYEVLFLLEDQVDTRAMDADFYARNLDLKQRNVELITTLKAKSASTQSPFLQKLNNSNQARNVHSYWITNLIYAEVKLELLAELSQDRAFELIDLNADLQLDDYSCEEDVIAPPPVPNGKEPGIRAIGAPEMWAMGYSGYGRIAFTSDTGVDPTHPALIDGFRGNCRPSSEAWFQFQGNNDFPFDCDDHGTHVTGTMVGLDRVTNDTIGVAYNSQWVGSPSIVCVGGGSASNIAAFEWALDPDGDPSTIDDMPDVVNNSWWDPAIQNDCNNIYISTFNTVEASKVAIVFSAGNSGPDASSITNPKNINTDLVNTFCVGALNGNGSLYNIADFSSRGPSTCDDEGSLAIKPEVSAPGESVRSSVPGGEYDNFSGTSMAAPHTSGAILLLREAFPNITGTEVKMALYMSAIDLGAAGEDNVYGRGIINVPAAYQYLIDQGHTPTPPAARGLDAIAVNAEIAPTACPGNVYFYFTFENGGTDTLTSVTINYTLDDIEMSYEWTGNLPPNGIRRIGFDDIELELDAGDLELTVELVSPNGLTDDRPLNNKILRRVELLDRTPINAYADGVADAYCQDSEILLRAEYDGLGEIDVDWYTEPFGGTAVGEGSTLPIGPLSESQTFYAEAKLLLPAGKDSPGANAVVADVATPGLRFDSFREFRLKSVLVYFDEPGLRLIKLVRDDNGDEETLGTKIANLSGDSPARVNLFFGVPVENNLRLLVQQGDPLAISTEDVDFPYVLDDVLQIEQSLGTNIVTSLTEYHCFYDWEIEIPEPCGRVPVRVEVIEGTESPTAAFDNSTTEIFLSANAPVEFTNNSENGSTYSWNFGDGSSLTDAESPTHTFTEEGIYTVSLTTFNAEGCSDFATTEITVVDDTSTSITRIAQANWDIQLFPNPSSASVTLRFALGERQNLSYRLVDVHGRILKSFASQAMQVQDISHDLSDIDAGVYYFIFENDRERTVRKWVKM